MNRTPPGVGNGGCPAAGVTWICSSSTGFLEQSQQAARGFPLVGGRLEYVGARPVAALVYGRRQNVINVFLWPVGSGPTAGPAALTRQGYHPLHWVGPEYTYWVVSDLGVPELRQFVGLLQQPDSTTPVRV